MKLIKLLFVVITGLVIANVTLTNRTIDEGVLVSRLQSDITELRNENTILQGQIAKEGALGAVETRLAEAGFVESPTVVSLTTSTAVASRYAY